MSRISILCAAALLSAAASAARPVEWKNIDAAHRCAGRQASSGYLRGKVVYVDCRDYGRDVDEEAVRRMQETWDTFKMKPFVMLGSHRGAADAAEVGRLASRLGLTYPIYADAGIARAAEDEASVREQAGLVFVVDCTGRVLFRGRDDRRAFGVIASALMAMASPQTPKQWQRYIDFDIDVLPGRALNEIEEFRKAFPAEARAYDAVWARLGGDREVVRLAKLERLTLQAKDYDFRDASARRLNAEKVDQAIALFSDLKKSGNPAVAQEAKNCIAELTWTAARLKDGR